MRSFQAFPRDLVWRPAHGPGTSVLRAASLGAKVALAAAAPSKVVSFDDAIALWIPRRVW
jgi:hypothetical protein